MAEPLKAASIGTTRCAGCGAIHVIMYGADGEPIADAAMPIETAYALTVELAEACEATFADLQAGTRPKCEGLH